MPVLHCRNHHLDHAISREARPRATGQPRGAHGQILQNQQRQRPLAALILEWLGNGHGARLILVSEKSYAACSHWRLLLIRWITFPSRVFGRKPDFELLRPLKASAMKYTQCNIGLYFLQQKLHPMLGTA